jgi:hypothetical protein
MTENVPATNYSAEVDMWMECGEHGNVPLAQAASTFVISAIPATVPAACIALIVLMIDGKRLERPVRLVSSLSPESPKAMVSSHDSIAPF